MNVANASPERLTGHYDEAASGIPYGDDVFAAIKRCHEVVHAMGTPRVSSTLRFGTRIDRPQTMDEKVQSVQQKLEE